MAHKKDEKVLLGQGPGLAHQCHDVLPTGAVPRRAQRLSYREIGQGSGARFMRRRVRLGIGCPGRPGESETGGHTGGAAVGNMPTKKFKRRNGQGKARVRLYVQEWGARRPVKKESRPEPTGDIKNRNTKVGIGNALRTDIAPSNVAQAGPGGSSASARQAAAAIRFARFAHWGQAWARSMTRPTGSRCRLPPTTLPGGKEPRAPAFLGPVSCSAGRIVNTG